MNTCESTDNMAVQVAKDVLKHLRGYRWTKGSYLVGQVDGQIAGDLQQHADRVMNSCHVCLKGACLISKARLFDDVPMSKLIRFSQGSTYTLLCPHFEYINTALAGIFDPDTWALMEVAFEMDKCHGMTVKDRAAVYNAYRFGKQFFNHRPERVQAVMENVIANNGRFIPPVFVPTRSSEL